MGAVASTWITVRINYIICNWSDINGTIWKLRFLAVQGQGQHFVFQHFTHKYLSRCLSHLPCNQWRSQDLEVGHRGSGKQKSPSGVEGQSPWWVVRGGIASRKLIAVIKDIWLPNHAQFCVFSSTVQPGIFLWTQFHKREVLLKCC